MYYSQRVVFLTFKIMNTYTLGFANTLLVNKGDQQGMNTFPHATVN